MTLPPVDLPQAPPADHGAPAKSTAPAPDSAPTTPRRAVRSFVVRAGRIGTGQRRALDELGPTLCLPYASRPLDLEQAFGRAAPVILEIGFGMGDATAEAAAADPSRNLLGIEVHEAGVGALLRLIGERGLAHVRIVRHDAVEVLRHMIAPGSLDEIRIWFPDPWPKKRHHKRRLIQPAFVALAASRLAPGGRLHAATDWQPYARQMLDVLCAEPSLRNIADGYAPRPASRPLTKFERRGLALGHGVWDLVFERT
jgi:tRNA (guanine-N7-)-methyltransferase